MYPKTNSLTVVAFAALTSFPQTLAAVEFIVDPIQGAGFVSVDAGGLPQILGAPVGSLLELDYIFSNMQHVELDASPSTNMEFGIGNTGNNVDLDYRIVVDLSDMNGNLLTNEAIVIEGTAQAGFIDIVSQPLLPLPPIIFHDFHISVTTAFADPVTGGGLFDLYFAGGGGDPGTAVSGPVIFNRAQVGQWIPEPTTVALLLWSLTCLATRARNVKKFSSR